ncbi:hypothetical protein ROHU_017157 [Labeo rohita]|uniref:Uncharacterized protein n=1 Tax=Labeo rohita TaxID=84645 RepID=A0A498NHB9_LABRO|nr:hypothetical protein ROHU_017157 [Labeo rohita]
MDHGGSGDQGKSEDQRTKVELMEQATTKVGTRDHRNAGRAGYFGGTSRAGGLGSVGRTEDHDGARRDGYHHSGTCRAGEMEEEPECLSCWM